VIGLGNPPAKCVGGGPPIEVPDGGGGQDCTGNLGQVSFTYALCACEDIGPLSQLIFTDAFDSTLGPYTPGGIGGGVAADGTISDSTTITIGGDLWVAGSAGLLIKANSSVKSQLHNGFGLALSKTLTITGKAFIGGLITSQGGGGGTSNVLTTPDCSAVPFTFQPTSCVSAPVTVAPPCDCTNNGLIPVRTIVAYFSVPAHNDNAAIGLSPTVLQSPSTDIRLDLPCGYYYLNTINANHTATIVVHGHTGLFIGGSIISSQNIQFDVDPGATLDIFVGGVVKNSATLTVGSPAYPRLSRVYFGSGSCNGNGGTCSAPADCCSGICNADGTCGGTGGSLGNAVEFSNTALLNGLFWAGYGHVKHSGTLTMYGAIFSQSYDASGDTIIHYDRGATTIGNECPPPDTGCNSCRDCGNQACDTTKHVCTSCQTDGDCCSPLRCQNGTCVLSNGS